MNGDSEDAVLRGIFTVPAIRAVVDEPRPINGDEPDNAEKKEIATRTILERFILTHNN
tara:strand:+ start:34354 stop:34527 length:174 start_codon:yes stop_codon:yes gene_type:complete